MKSYYLFLLAFLFCVNAVYSQSGTFDLEDATFNIGPGTTTQTVDGVLLTVSTTAGNANVASYGADIGGSGNVCQASAFSNMTLTFTGGPVNITTIRAADTQLMTKDWTFTPNPLGSNTAKTVSVDGTNGTTVTLNFVSITSISITQSTVNDGFVFDNLVMYAVDMTFNNGSSYTPSDGTPGTDNNPIGRFQLTGSAAGGVLQGVTVSISGTRSGVTSVKLWSSTDNSFSSGSDTQLASASDATSISFSGFNSSVDNSTGTYYFVTMDLAAGASGSVTAAIPSQASFTFAWANNPSSFTNAALSSAAVPLPVELTSFTALANSNSVTLNWATATEVNNYGFQVERRKLARHLLDGEKVESEWEEISFVQGHGNSNSPKSYSFTDNSPLGGNVQYRLKQIDFDGAYKYYGPVDVTVNVARFALNQNFPNPFNPVTTISYTLPQKAHVNLSVFDVLGREVTNLVNKEEESGVYNVQFNGSNLNSGIYFYELRAGNYSEVKKLLLVK